MPQGGGRTPARERAIRRRNGSAICRRTSRARFIRGLDRGKVVCIAGEIFRRLAVEQIAGANFQLVERAEHVQFGDGEPVNAVDHCRVAERGGVEPPAPAGASRRCAVFVAFGAEPVAGRIVALAGERPVADARAVRFHNADNAGDCLRRNAQARASAAARRTAGRDIRVRAVVNVQKRPLRAFENEILPIVDGGVQVRGRVGNVFVNFNVECGVFFDDLINVKFFGVVQIF